MNTNSSVTVEAVACRQAARGALCTLFGIVVSGPLAWILLQKFFPQPPWDGAEFFARNFHWAQSLPYLAGLALVVGYVVLMSGLYSLAEPQNRPAATAAL